MSQFWINGNGGGGGGGTFTLGTDVNVNAVSVDGVINTHGVGVLDNSDAGQFSLGSNGMQDWSMALSNRIWAKTTTSDDTPTAIFTFTPPLGYAPNVGAINEGVYSFDVNIASYNTTDTLGASYSIFVGSRSDGTNMFKLNIEDKIVNEEVGEEASDVTVSVSGNSLIFNVVGIPGKTILWTVTGYYTFAGSLVP